MKKYILTSIFLAFTFVSLPAKAFLLPLLVVASESAAAWAGGLSTAETIALSGSAAFHAALLAIEFTDSSAPAGSPPALTVNLSPVAPVSGVPAGWAAAAQNGGYPTPPTTAPTSETFYDGGFTSTVYSNLASACAGYAQGFAKSFPSSVVIGTPVGTHNCWVTKDGNNLTSTSGDSLYSGMTCPSGYAASGSNCNLSDATKVALPNDGTKAVPRVGDALTPSTRDTDPMPQNVTQPDANTIKYTNPSTGETVQVQINPTDHTGQITHTTPDPANAQTKVETFQLSAPDASGTGNGRQAVNVSGTGSNTYSGTGTSTGTTPIATGSGSANSGTGTGETWGSGPALTGAFDGLIDNVNKAPQSVPTVDVSWLPSLKPSASPVTCTPIPLSQNFTNGLLAGIHGEASLDICDKLDLMRQIMGWLFGVLTIFYIFRVFTRANQGA